MNKPEETCVECIHLKGGQRIYCEKTGLCISGTLERSDKCKKDNLKEALPQSFSPRKDMTDEYSFSGTKVFRY